MTDKTKQTHQINGQLWGQGATDWASYQEPYMAPVFNTVLKRTNVREGTLYLDLGCGSGLAAAKASAKGAKVTGLDASSALLEIATSRLPGVDFHIGDLEELPFENDQFDVVTGFNSFQYAGTPTNALKEAARVTAPSGIVAITTWGPPDGMDAAQIVAAVKPLLPSPPPGAPGPFALSDEGRLRQFARDGGLEPQEVFDVDGSWFYPDEVTALKGLSSSGVAAKAIGVVGQEAVDNAHAAAIAPYRQADGSFHIGATFRVLLAQPKTT